MFVECCHYHLFVIIHMLSLSVVLPSCSALCVCVCAVVDSQAVIYRGGCIMGCNVIYVVLVTFVCNFDTIHS